MSDFLEIVQQWGSLVAFAMNALFMAALYFLRKTFVSHEDYAAGKARLEDRLDEFEGQLAKVENRLEAMPSASEVKAILIGQTRLEGKIDTVNANMRAVERTTGMLLKVHIAPVPGAGHEG